MIRILGRIGKFELLQQTTYYIRDKPQEKDIAVFSHRKNAKMYFEKIRRK